jgi:hypothetical protein
MRRFYSFRRLLFKVIRTLLEPECCAYTCLVFVILVFVATMRKIQDFRDNKLPNEVFAVEEMQLTSELYNRSVVAIESNKWLINKRILTFTTIADITSDIVYFYIITLTNGNFISEGFHSGSLKCVFKYGERFVWTQPAAELFEMDSYNEFKTHKITCALRFNSSLLVGNFSVGLIDVRVYKNTVDGQNIIFTQRPKNYNRVQPLIAGVIGTLLSLRNVDSNSFVQVSNWIGINKAIGLSNIKIFTFEFTNPHVQKIKEDYSDFVEIIDYEVDVLKICSYLTDYVTNAQDFNYEQVR